MPMENKLRNRGKSQWSSESRVKDVINLLCRSVVFFDGTIDEGGDVASSSACLIGGFRNTQLAKKLIKHLDRLLILGFGVGRI